MNRKELAKASLSKTGKTPEEVREILTRVGDLLEEAGVPSFCTAIYTENEDAEEVVSYLSNYECSHLTMYEMFYSVITRNRKFADFFIAFGMAMKKAMDTGMYDKIQQIKEDEDKTSF